MRDGNGGQDLAVRQPPEAQGVCLLDANSRDGLQDSQRNHKVRGKDDILLKVDAQTVRAELLSKNVELHVWLAQSKWHTRRNVQFPQHPPATRG